MILVVNYITYRTPTEKRIHVLNTPVAPSPLCSRLTKLEQTPFLFILAFLRMRLPLPIARALLLYIDPGLRYPRAIFVGE